MHYSVLLKVGAGDFDLVMLHRVVRELPNGMPVPGAGSYFFIHGSTGTFRKGMVRPHGDAGLGVFLAARNVDVWGIDLRNVQIPAGTTDLSFARDWGFDVGVKDVLLGTRVARHVRALGGRRGGIILGGVSAGAALTYAVANAETALSPEDRDVAGLIPTDIAYTLAPEATVQSTFSCQVEALYRSFRLKGPYLATNSNQVGVLARDDPNGVSPLGAPLTNLQFALERAAALTFRPAYPLHSYAVVRDSAGIAAAGRYTRTSEIVAAQATAEPAYAIPNAMIADLFGAACPTSHSPYADRLEEVQVPILYVGQAGGYGRFGEDTVQRLGSSDKTTLIIQLQSDAEAADDFGHGEFFTAEQAPALIWKPIHAWIAEHSEDSRD